MKKYTIKRLSDGKYLLGLKSFLNYESNEWTNDIKSAEYSVYSKLIIFERNFSKIDEFEIVEE